MRSSRVAAVIGATLLTLAPLTLTACTTEEEPDPGPPPAEPTPLAELATESLTIARKPFCAQIAPAAVEDALGGAPERRDQWVNGDRATVAPGVADVVHEYGCRWRAVDGTAVSGWVFAPPIAPGRAAVLRRAAAQADGCRPVAGAPAYGSPSVAVTCDDGTTAFHGLFGDAWLSCSVSAPGAEVGRVGRWCVSVAQAASA